MKSLNTYINEGLSDWSDDKLDKKISKQTTIAAIKQEIIEWIKNNTFGRKYEIKFKFDFNTTPITVNYDDDIDFKIDITSLTNGLFQWGKVSGCFSCANCVSLKSLDGAPKDVGISFYCHGCSSLETLEGAPKKVGEYFNCENCKSLTSLKGAPKEVGWEFCCAECGTKFTEKDVKKVCKVRGRINC